MQTTSRNYSFGRDRDPAVTAAAASSKRGHATQISISDDNHHVTEAIGNMYDDHQYGKQQDPRPLSFVSSSRDPPPSSANTQSSSSPSSSRHGSARRVGPSPPRTYQGRPAPVQRGLSTERQPHTTNGPGGTMASRSNSKKDQSELSPSGSLKERSASDTANSHFPLNDLDYESSPNAVAQELNNLAALRRMSMDVNTADPDLPSFSSSSFSIPSAPPENDDQDNPSQLYWVPASVHPELAPMEFKTFLDKKVKSLKRRSEERGSLSPEGSLHRGGSGASLRRKKSMLSKQIDNTNGRGAVGYQDGAERIERRKSQLGLEPMNAGISNLQDLEVLVNEPERALQRLSLERGGDGEDVPGDVPILPAAPSGNSLRRSTRTTYRRGGSLRKGGERVPFSKRAAHLAEQESEEHKAASPITPEGEAESLSRVQTEPMPASERVTENFSRPGRLNRRAGITSPPLRSYEEPLPTRSPIEPPRQSTDSPRRPSIDSRDRQGRETPSPGHFVSKIASNGRIGVPTESLHSKTAPSIDIIPPSDSHGYRPPERSSSYVTPPPPPPAPQAPSTFEGPRTHHKQTQSRTNQTVKPNQTLSDMSSHPSPLPGNNTRTDSLSFIPTLTEDKKGDSKKDGGRKSSWSWGALLGSEEKEKEKRRAEEEKESKKKTLKIGKAIDKTHDNTRLDLLQTTMEGNSRGRESLVLDRGDLKLEEERKKESSRKAAGADPKKEKDPGFFSSLLGAGKRKGDRDSGGKKHASRNLSPEPPTRILKPDIDYNWTRFSILEERAIYRMAHIKLANPRRALHSQVLLSNFMYSYLAKVQQMHPQANLPQSAAQRQAAAQQKKDQPEEFSQYQKYQQQQERQQQLEDQQAAAAAAASSPTATTASSPSTPPSSQTSNNPPSLSPVQSQAEPTGSFMDMDYDYDRDDAAENNSRYRPQSRQSQHDNNNSGGGSNGNGYGHSHSGNNSSHGNQRRGQQQGQYQQQYQQEDRDRERDRGYAYQEGQFDEPERGDDEMW